MSAMRMVLANLEVSDVLADWQNLGAGAREKLIIFGAMGLIVASVTVWAVFFRKSRRRRHRHHHGQHPSQAPARDAAAASSDGDPSQPRKRLKWRRPRREHRPRNPTLAETGGLPPARTGDPPEIQS